MNIQLVCHEDIYQWILGKFALRMEENLTNLGINVKIDNVPNIKADVNHHINYGGYNSNISSLDTLMITHIDSTHKITLLKNQMKFAKMGICMSKETMVNLSNLGIPRSKLSYVNPAHDGVLKPRPYSIGITCRVQPDGRKREYMLGKLVKRLNPDEFSFKIMGEYWTHYVNTLRNNGFRVKYYEKFEYSTYINLISSIDFYLYMGRDEGQMGFIDALAAGVKTIVTPQGYHLDANNGISYPFQTFDELLNIFECIAEEKRKLVRSISSWNWLDYTKKHVDIWNYLLNPSKFRFKKKEYADGIMSVEKFDKNCNKVPIIKKVYIYKNLIKERIRHSYYLRKNKNKGN